MIFMIVKFLGKNIRHDFQEPLKIFTDAKMKMRDIFNNLEECIVEMATFYAGS